jgi:WD40 repeat protein
MYRLVFAPNRNLLASLGADGTVSLFQVPSGRELARPSWLPKIGGCAFSPDGSLLATTAHEVKIYEVATGKLRLRLAETAGEGFGHPAFSPDGTLLAAENGGPVLWSVKTGKRVPVVALEDDLFRSLAFSPTGKWLAAAGKSVDQIYFWDLVKKKADSLRMPKGFGVNALAFSPDGSLLAAASNKQPVVILWDVKTRKEVARVTPGDDRDIYELHISPDGSTIAAVTSDCHLWRIVRGRKLSPLSVIKDASRCAFSHDGTYLATVGPYPPIRLWKKDRAGRYQPLADHRAPVLDAAWSPDGRTVALYDGSVTVWQASSGRPLQRLGIPALPSWFDYSPGSLTFSPDGALLAGKDAQGASVWKLKSGKCLHRIDERSGPIVAQSFLQGLDCLVALRWNQTVRWDQDKLITAYDDFRLYRIPLAGGVQEAPVVLIGPLRRVPGSRRLAAFSLDGRILATVNFDGAVQPAPDHAAFRLRKEGPPVPFRASPDKPTPPRTQHMALSADGRSLAFFASRPPSNRSAEEAKNQLGLDIVEITSGCLRATLPGVGEDVNCVGFSPDGRMVASGDKLGFLCLRDVVTGRELCRIHAHPGQVFRVSFSPSGDRLVTGSIDSTALIWDVTALLKDRLPQKRPERLGERQLALLWQSLAGDDAAAAYRASWALSARPDEALPCLAKRLSPVVETSAQRLRDLIKDLEARDFRTRQRAEETLHYLGERATLVLRQALKEKPSLEFRRRVERILGKVEKRIWSSRALLEDRVLEVLERIASREAMAQVEKLAKGAADALLTQRARATLWRMRQRKLADSP